MTIWAVIYEEEDYSRIIAAYDSELVAQDHIERTGEGRIEAIDVLTALPHEVALIDPIVAKQTREAEARVRRGEYLAAQAKRREADARTEAMTIGDRARLCHCRTFSNQDFTTANGYCRYCGGWTPEVFRAKFGDAGLRAAIELLDYHDRTKMYKLTGLIVDG